MEVAEDVQFHIVQALRRNLDGTTTKTPRCKRQIRMRSVEFRRMALSEHERFRFEKPVKTFIEARRPPPHIRPELDLGYRFVNQSVEIFEIRPAYLRPGELMESAVAKATYVKSKNLWKIYWKLSS